MNATRYAILAGFFLSGATGLIYQNLWIRMLTLVVGGTTAALTTILIAFMGGLALGSWLFGSWADRARSPLKLYAVIEAAIGAYALVIPLAFDAVPSIYRALHAIDPAHGAIFAALRFVLAVAFFAIPSTLMGGTLPLIIKSLSRRGSGLQLTVATAYAINTFGATVGAFLTGFVVIPTLGIDLTMQLTAGLNFLLAAVFFWALAPRAHSPSPDAQQASTAEPRADIMADGRPRPSPSPALLMIFFLMGASSLSYEILWSRLLGLSFGSSVYAISTMLTAFLLGIALGSWWLRRRAGAQPTLMSLGWLEVGIALSGLVAIIILIKLPWVVQYLYLLPWVFTQVLGPEASELGFWCLQLGLFVLAVAAMIIPTSLMGASFPMAVHIYADGAVGRSVGRVYASNTFGSIIGSFLTGFFLVEAVGTRAALMGWTVVNLALGAGLIAFAAMRAGVVPKPRRLVGAALAGGGLFMIIPHLWDLDTLTSGVYYHVMGMDRGGDRGEVTFTAEDDMALVSLHSRHTWDEPEPIQVMRINGKFMADDGGRVPMLHLYAHAPLLIRGPGAQRAMVIGLGGGYTAEAALTHPLQQVDVLEISHAVVEAAKIMNPPLFDDPRLTVFEEDARSFLITGDTRYDVIISETSDPWITGVSNLYTEECFRWISERLAPRGVFGTWLQTRHKTVEDVQTILRTMNRVFPHMAAFQFAEGDTVLLMSNEPMSFDRDEVVAISEQIEEELGDIGIFDAFHIPGGVLMGEDSLAAYLGDGPINTDDLPIIEFSTPRSLNIGLKGAEVWEDLILNAPQNPDFPFAGLDDGAHPSERALWHTHRLMLMGNDAGALAQLRSANQAADPAAPASISPLLEARLLLRLGRHAEALELARSQPPSPRRSLLIAGALLFTDQLDALERWLTVDEPWGSLSGRWERRIWQRREVLRQGLGMDPSQLTPGASSP